MLFVNRTGSGQWADRANAVAKCDRNIANNDTTCVRPPGINTFNGVDHKEFLQFLVQYPFIACVHGGGIDPSPKAWEAIMLGMCVIVVCVSVLICRDGYKCVFYML